VVQSEGVTLVRIGVEGKGPRRVVAGVSAVLDKVVGIARDAVGREAEAHGWVAVYRGEEVVCNRDVCGSGGADEEGGSGESHGDFD